MRLLRFETLLFLLVLASVGLLVAGPGLLRTRLVLDAGSGFSTALRNDAEIGGDSRVEAEPGSTYAWRCELRGGTSYPFCGFELLIDPKRLRGLDLSRYDRLRLQLDYEGPARTLRLFLRNADPRYSVPGDALSTKFNQVEFAAGERRLDVSLRDFYVANWWMSAYDIPPQLGHPQLDNVVSIELQTGTQPSLGEHRFALRSIEFEGQRLSTEQLYLSLVVGWLSLIVGWILHRLLSAMRELKQRQQRERELLQINALLDARGRQLEARAQTDPLTGALNRRGLEQAIRAALTDRRGALSLILLDIDHFKRINDLHGHVVGDQVLSELSQRVQGRVRDSDRLARWGGEEFVLLCRSCDLRQAMALAEKLRGLIASEPFADGIDVTASFGVATLGPGQSLEALFTAADAALYRAKREGRNRVHAADTAGG